MREEMKAFARVLSTISATMASISFVGVSIIVNILYQSKDTVWKTVAYFGAASVFWFAFASITALIAFYPKSKKKERLLRLAIETFAIGWAFFFILIIVLIAAFAS